MRVHRRYFLMGSGAAILGVRGMGRALAGEEAEARAEPVKWSLRTLTKGPKHHFFGYYGICPWNASGKRLVCLESTFQDRMPTPGEAAVIGLVDPKTGAFKKVAETRAWNLQQGAMLHWNPLSPEDEIIHNDRAKDGSVVSAILNVNSGKRRDLPRPVSAVSHDGRHALSLTYGRLGRLRKVVGYGTAGDPYPDDPAPEKDGVFLMDLRTGTTRLVVPIAEVYRRVAQTQPTIKGRHMWFNHTVFSRDDRRFFFLARAYLPPGRNRHTAMFTANKDGSELREVIPLDKRVSHFDWRSEKEIIATFEIDGSHRKHVLFTDGRGDYRVIGSGFLDFDGHCSFAPDRDWLVTDRKQRKTLEQSLLIYSMSRRKGYELCRYGMGEEKYISGNVRCDFHPRWNRVGDQICFDAIEPKGWTRQLHIASLQGL